MCFGLSVLNTYFPNLGSGRFGAQRRMHATLSMRSGALIVIVGDDADEKKYDELEENGRERMTESTPPV